ncbi:MAG: serine/threonine-protein phosphatase [Polyangiaceae bacterium]|nr:serine/threonine-protein phosphatase [Polyangiaceae bacterium]
MPRAGAREDLRAADFDAAGATSVGLARERNEDQFLIACLERTLRILGTSVGVDTSRWGARNTVGTLLVVADGMGGQGGGDVASSVAVHSVAEYLCSVMPWFDRPGASGQRRDSLPGVRTGLAAAVAQGERAVQQAAEARVDAPKMGTTLTIAYAHYPLLYLAHVGDSRCYLWRQGALFQLTRDHTVAEQLRQRLGQEVDVDPQWHHVLWNAVGAGSPEAQPDIRRHRLAPNDVLLLCSDGLTKHVPDERIAELLAAPDRAATRASSLVHEANLGGGSDNITAVVAHCIVRPDPVAEPPR